MGDYTDYSLVQSQRRTFFFSEFRFEGLELGLFAETALALLPPLRASNKPCCLNRKQRSAIEATFKVCFFH